MQNPSKGANPHYTTEEIFRRWNLLLSAFAIFKPAYTTAHEVTHEIGIDPFTLYQAVESYFHDLSRYKSWHLDDPTKKADDTKQFAFTVYWLMKKRPIYICTPLPELLEKYKSNKTVMDEDPTILANAHFAFVAGGNFQDAVVKGELAAELLYGLSYRDYNKDSLLMIASMLKLIQSAPGAAIHVTQKPPPKQFFKD